MADRKFKGYWNDAEFALDVDAASIQGPPPKARLLLFFVILVILAAMAWAHYSIIDEVTHAEGKVIPSSQLQVVQNLEGGILEEVLVREGDAVEQGQVLLRINNTGLEADYGEIESRVVTLRGEIYRLTAEAEGQNLAFPVDFEQDNPRLAQAQMALLQAREAELKSQISILRNQMDQRRQERQEIIGKIELSKDSLKIVEEELAINTPLADQGIVPKSDMLRIRKEINQLTSEIKSNRLALPRSESAITEAQRRIEEKLLAFKAAALAELNEKRNELESLTEQTAAAKDRVTRKDVRSPLKGIVKTLHKNTLGGVVRPGEDLAEIVPVDETLLIEARIRPADIAFLSPNQDTMVKFTAYDFSIYGGLPGKLVQIAADTVVDEKTDEEFYKIVVKTEKNHLTRGSEILPIIPGMITSVDVITGEKSVLSYLMKPILKAQNKALTER